jgi:hypothetical protein
MRDGQVLRYLPETRQVEVVAGTRQGPLRERMADIGARVDESVEEAWRAARQGHALSQARKRIDTGSATRKLAELTSATGAGAGAALEQTGDALRAQLATAERLDRTIAEARQRLGLTNAKLDEAVARAAELSVAAHDVAQLQGLGDDVDALVDDLEALRLGLEEIQRPGLGSG